jgi:hypothetical protein
MEVLTFERVVAFLGVIWTVIGAFVARAAANRSWLRDFLARLLVERRAVVFEVRQTYVDQILKARLDGALTPLEKEEAKQMAMRRLLEVLGVAAIERALRVMGLPTLPAFVHRWLTTHLESAVKELDLEMSAAGAGPRAADSGGGFEHESAGAITRPLPGIKKP